jgi:PAS domain-containing protein
MPMKSASGLRTLLAMFAVWIVLAMLSYVPGDLLSTVALVWLPTGAALAVAGVVNAWRLPWVLAASGLAAWGFSLGSGMPFTTALMEGVGETLSVLSGAALLRASRSWGDARLRWLGQVTACAITSVLNASSFVIAWQLSEQSLPWAVSWVYAAVGEWVGALLIVPIVVSFSAFRAKRSGGMTMLHFGGGAVAYAGFLIAASLVFQGDVGERFGQTLGPSLTYLPLSLLVLTALVWGERGGVLAIALGAALMIGWTVVGRGPFALNEGFPGEALLEVQAYVAAIALLSGLMLSLQAHTAHALENARRWKMRYLQVLETGGFATLSIDASSGVCAWSENASQFLGKAPDETVAALIERAEPADQPLMRSQWRSLQEGNQASARWTWPDSRQATLCAVAGPDGRVELVTALFVNTGRS